MILAAMALFSLSAGGITWRRRMTQDVLVLRFEAQDQASLEAIRAEVEEQVRRAMDQS